MTKTSDLEERFIDLQRQCADCTIELLKKEQTIANMDADINELHIRLQQSESMTALARKLFHKFDSKIMYELTERGKKKQSVMLKHPRIVATKQLSYAEMIVAARIYDTKEFFTFKHRVSKSTLRPHYRIAAKVYRTGRDGLLYTGAKLYRKARKA